MKGDPAASLPLFDRALAVAAGEPSLADLRLVLQINHAAALGNLDRYGDAIRAAEQVRQLADDPGNVVRRLQAQAVLGELFFDTGQWDDALAEVEVGRDWAKDPAVHCVCRSLAALIGLHRGEASASQHVAGADRYARRLGDRVISPHVLARSLEREQADAPDHALGVLMSALSKTEEVEPAVAVLADATRLAVTVRDQATARFLVDRAEAVAHASDVPRPWAILSHCRGLVENDQVQLLQAATHYQTSGQLLLRAQALEAAAPAAADAGNISTARSHFTNALFLYTVLHADWDLARTHARLRAYGIGLNPPG